MMNIKRHIPNAITCLNLLSGAGSVLALAYPLTYGGSLSESRLDIAVALIALAAGFDFFDGLVARALGVSSPIGKDLDSLADVVSFGLAPSLLIVTALSQILLPASVNLLFTLPVLLIAAFAALRLAKFNNDTRQTTSFRGLPVPANALFWSGYAFALPELYGLFGGGKEALVPLLGLSYLLVGLLCYLMVSDLPMFSFKLKDFSFSSLVYPLSLLVISVVSICLFGTLGLCIAILAYVSLSFLERRKASHTAS